ncbi:hypothetical protein [uncultured Bacteroides sp.]|nr:hypothetical protein [uncultured Bacteroides sp.]
MEMEKFYVAPEVEVLEVEIERGFAGSSTDGSVGDIEIPDDF